jgi:hypothetical protein
MSEAASQLHSHFWVRVAAAVSAEESFNVGCAPLHRISPPNITAEYHRRISPPNITAEYHLIGLQINDCHSHV